VVLGGWLNAQSDFNMILAGGRRRRKIFRKVWVFEFRVRSLSLTDLKYRLEFKKKKKKGPFNFR
jgi:hypothetical protein